MVGFFVKVSAVWSRGRFLEFQSVQGLYLQRSIPSTLAPSGITQKKAKFCLGQSQGRARSWYSDVQTWLARIPVPGMRREGLFARGGWQWVGKGCRLFLEVFRGARGGDPRHCLDGILATDHVTFG